MNTYDSIYSTLKLFAIEQFSNSLYGQILFIAKIIVSKMDQYYIVYNLGANMLQDICRRAQRVFSHTYCHIVRIFCDTEKQYFASTVF